MCLFLKHRSAFSRHVTNEMCCDSLKYTWTEWNVLCDFFFFFTSCTLTAKMDDVSDRSDTEDVGYSVGSINENELEGSD